MAARLRAVPWRRSPNCVNPLIVALYFSRSSRATSIRTVAESPRGAAATCCGAATGTGGGADGGCGVLQPARAVARVRRGARTGFIWWPRAKAESTRPPSAGTRLLEHAHREERRQRVVRRAQPSREQTHARPKHLVRHLAIEIEEHLEIGTRDRQHRRSAIRNRVRRALAPVEHRHLTEQRAGLQHGQRFFATAGYVAADPHFAFDDQIETI